MTKVLLIDDCEELREVVGELLAESGYQVVVAATPAEGRAWCERERFDVILCDLVMPTDTEDAELSADSPMVGVSAIHELSRSYPNTPIIAVSGELSGAPLRGMESFGAVSTLAKPFGRDDLVGAIEAALAQR